MPRKPRIKSRHGLYHVMMRGIDKRNIFVDENDYVIFLKCMEKAKEKGGCSIYGYCLMTNHVHILIKENSEPIGDTIRRIAVGYVQRHNFKYERTGHLFQNRFKSEPIENKNSLLKVLRYIHQNPLKAGIVKYISDYQWSSYIEYLDRHQINIIETEFIFSVFDNVDSFVTFMNKTTDDTCLEYSIKKKCSDSQLLSRIESIIGISAINDPDIQVRNKKLKEIKQITQASNRQLSRVLGVGRGILERIR